MGARREKRDAEKGSRGGSEKGPEKGIEETLFHTKYRPIVYGTLRVCGGGYCVFIMTTPALLLLLLCPTREEKNTYKSNQNGLR